MIPAARFIAESTDRESWLAARRGGVTATEVAKASTPAGFVEAVEARRNPVEITPNAFMEFGSEHENWIALDLKRQFGIMPNRWLIASETNPLHMATPDGLSLDQLMIAEIKTGGTHRVKVPIAHKRQIQFQLYVTGAESCIYAFMRRIDVNGVLVPAWLTPETREVLRDDEMIADLVATADRLLLTDEEDH